ncbi:MAG: RNA polymerase Rpb4 family protein [Candidatus Diapherotrites archaeon]
MIGKTTISKKPVSLFEVKEILSERSKEGELNYEQQAVLDYSTKFSPLTKAKSDKLFEQLSQIDGLSKGLVVKLVDLLPKDEEELNLLLVKGVDLTEEQKKSVLGLIQKYIK